jgi:hypothetical protein
MAGSTATPRAPHAAAAVALALLMSTTALVGSAAAKTQTLSCAAVITTSTKLAGEVGPCRGEGLIVAADGITLDLNGHRVFGGDPHARRSPDKAGLLLRGVSGVTVTNGTVEGFDAGVTIMGGGHNRIRKVTAKGNVNYRVLTGRDSQAADVVSEDGPFCDLGDGIAVFNSSGNVLQHNKIVGNGPFSGVSLIGDADNNVVSKNKFRDNDILNDTPQGWGTICGSDIDGPVADPGPPAPPPDNTANDSCCATLGRHVQDVGARIEGPGAERNSITANRITTSGLMGIMVHGNNTMAAQPANSYTVIRGNHISETAKIGHNLDRQGHGIYLHQPGPPFVFAPPNTLIEDNVSSRNYGGGIFLDSKGTLHSTVVRNNVVNDNGLDGLYVNGPGSAAGLPNVMRNNQGHGNGARAEEVNAGRDPRANYFGTDGSDSSVDCLRNDWLGNRFGTVNQACVASRAAEAESATVGDRRTGLDDGPLVRGTPERLLAFR